MKRFLTWLLLVCLCAAAQAERVTDDDDGPPRVVGPAPVVDRADCLVDLIADPDAQWSFLENAAILEIVIPQMAEADACILRMDGHVLMIDAGGEAEAEAVKQALTWMGVNEVETGLVTHPHHDHMPGFSILAEYVKLDRVLNYFSRNLTATNIHQLDRLAELGIPVEKAEDGDVLTIAGNGEQIHIFQRGSTSDKINDRSLLALVTYGQRSMLFLADAEKQAQRNLANNVPECGVSADILRYPHHGLNSMQIKLVELVAPRLSIITSTPERSKLGTRRMDEYGIQVVYTCDSAIRLRTDGVIWVLDRLTGPLQ